MTQAIFRDDNSREKLTVVITMPANVTHKSQLKVEFVGSSNGARMIVWVPRGGLSNNMDRLNKGYAGMPGLSQKTADFATSSLEDKLMVRCGQKKDIIQDPYGIVLDKACDPLKQPTVSVYKLQGDGDTVCCMVMDLLTKNDYDAEDVGRDKAEYLD
jgi:hypothetical protein